MLQIHCHLVSVFSSFFQSFFTKMLGCKLYQIFDDDTCRLYYHDKNINKWINEWIKIQMFISLHNAMPM